MNEYRDLLPIIQRLIGQGLVEQHDSIVTLTNKGRTDALLRWRGINDDAKILFGLWLKEQYDQEFHAYTEELAEGFCLNKSHYQLKGEYDREK